MYKTFEVLAGFLILIFMGVVLWQIIGMSSIKPIPEETYPPVKEQKTISDAFQFELEELVRIEIGQPIEGYEPQMFMQVLPGLIPEDFDGVEAQMGFYEYKNDELVHNLPSGNMIHSAAPAITDMGFNRLLNNIQNRYGSDHSSAESLVSQLKQDPQKVPENPTLDDYPDQHQIEPVACTKDAMVCPDGSAVERNPLNNCEFYDCLSESIPCPTDTTDCPANDSTVYGDVQPVACTMDAKVCPDGSAVGRIGPDCEFAECPVEAPKGKEVVLCSSESKQVEACTMEYLPVCGLVEVQCVTTPCDPVPQTFGNACGACAEGNVVSYTEGSCQTDLQVN